MNIAFRVNTCTFVRCAIGNANNVFRNMTSGVADYDVTYSNKNNKLFICENGGAFPLWTLFQPKKTVYQRSSACDKWHTERKVGTEHDANKSLLSVIF